MRRVFLEIQYSARKFVRTPGGTLALLSTIALGIGSNVSTYGFARGLTRPDSPLARVARIVSIFEQNRCPEAGPLSYQEYSLLKRDLNAFEWIAAARVWPANIVVAGQPAVVSVAALTPPLADALNLSMGKGVFISQRMWHSEFDGKNDVNGEQIRIDGVSARVSGIAPNSLEGLYRNRAIDIWMPSPEKSLEGADHQRRNLWVLGRLRRHISVNQAQNLIRRGEGSPGELIVLPYSGMTPEMAEGMSRIAAIFAFAAGAVFFVACANVVSLLLGRAFARSYETSVRAALGVRRHQLAGELLCDGVVISVAGGILGTLLAVWTAHIVPILLFKQDAEHLVFAPGLLTIILASTACVGVTILCGLMPAFVGPTAQPVAVLRRESAGPSKVMVRFRAGLAIAQMASCCVLVVSTAVLFDSLHAELRTGTGRQLGNPILVTVQKEPGPDTGIKYFQQVQMVAQSMPGIIPIAWAGQLPGSQPAWQSFRIDPLDLPHRDIVLATSWFTGDALKLFKLPPTSGRLFGFDERMCQVAIVNKSAAAELFDKDTVGRTILAPSGPPLEIIGVVAEKAGDARSLPTLYFNHADQTGPAPRPLLQTHFRAPTRSELAGAELDANVVSSDYFEAMRLSLMAGREFSNHRIPGDCRVAVVNHEAAELYFDSKAVGAGVIDQRGVRTAIIGVVHSRPFGTFQRNAEPAIFFPMWQDCLPRMTLIARARQLKASMLDDLRHTIGSVPGRGPAPVLVRTFATHLAYTSLATLRIATVVIGASATTALILSVLGLFGVLSDSARQHRRELAIRAAIGAQRWRIVYQVLKEGGRLAGAGVLLGTLGSLALSRLLASIIPGNTTPALWVWFAAPAVLALGVLIAGILPARRAAMVNPVTIMRDES